MNKSNLTQIGSEIFGIFEDVLASFLCCWINDSETYMSKDLCLNENGIIAYNSDEIRFQSNLNDESSKKSTSRTNKQVKSQIVHIAVNIFLSNPFEFMSKFMSLWMNEKNRFIANDKQYKVSMVELLVLMNLPMEIVINTITKNINVAKIKDYKKSKIKIKDSYPYYLNKDQCIYEAKICHLIYSYIIFNKYLKVDKSIVDIWNEMLNFLLIFMESKAPSTFFWIYEILNIILYKLPIRDTTGDYTIKKRLTLLMTGLFSKTMELAINNKMESLYEESSQLILPMSPSIYEKVAGANCGLWRHVSIDGVFLVYF